MELTKAVIFFVGFLVAVCMAVPAPSIKDEVESVKPVKTYGDQPIVDTGYFSGWDSPFSENPFGGLFDSLESVMERMRQQIASIISKFPGKEANSTEELPALPGFINGVDLPPFPNIGDIDLSKGNTTSVTKIVDGHKVVINETEYKNEDDFGGTFFKVRIIDVKPDSSELTTEKEAESIPDNSTPKPKDREEVENSLENEILKSSNEAEKLTSTESHDNISLYDNVEEGNKGQFDNIETFDEVDSREGSDFMSSASSRHNQRYSPIDAVERISSNKNAEWFEDNDVPKTLDTEWSKVRPVESIETNSIETENFKEHAGHPPFDLSRDTYVNEILAQNGAPMNPDAEVFYVAQKLPNRIEQLIDPR